MKDIAIFLLADPVTYARYVADTVAIEAITERAKVEAKVADVLFSHELKRDLKQLDREARRSR